jgi:DNA-binding NarL/FixJ family response regulator
VTAADRPMAVAVTGMSARGRRVLLVDDHAVVRKGLVLLLQSTFGFEVVEAWTATEAVRLGTDESVELILLDVRLGDPDGLWALVRIKAQRPDVPVIMLSTYASDEYVRGALDGGACAYLLKEASVEQLRDAVETALSGQGLYLHPGATQVLFDPPTRAERYASVLSERELTVLNLVADGATNDEVASTIHVSEKTVKSHLTSIYRKLHVTNRTQAAALALREGIVSSHMERLGR